MSTEVNTMKKILTKVASLLPGILLFVSIYCLVFSLTLGISESAKYQATAKTLATENMYHKKEIEWFKAQLEGKRNEAVPTISNSADPTDGDSNE
jgi:hypothetical protein